MAEDLEQKILEALDTNEFIEDTGVFAQQQGVAHSVLDGVLKRLNSYEMVKLDIIEKKVLSLTADGESVLANGSPEIILFNAVPANGSINKVELDAKVGPNVAKLGYGEANKLKWIKNETIEDKDAPKKDPKDKTPKIVLVSRNVEKVEDAVRPLLLAVKNNAPLSEADIKTLSTRRMVQPSTVKHYRVTKGDKYKPSINVVSNLTAAMLSNGSWKDASFKEFKLGDVKGKDPAGGHLHPLMKVRTEIREIFIGMGFEEMPTNNYVESSFWNFDSLFQPQQHPARDAHDTFFLKDPATSANFPPDYLERVKEVHSTGGYGSIGYRYDWKIEEAQKNILRTHTTAVSSRMLYKLAQNGFKPAKYFSIDRVFRNETLDATHLAEFHQIEGLVADYNLGLADLLGVISQFFQRLGIENIRFKPAYNPYTEPSMEIFGFHPLVKGGSWVELGNSGMFRPEMLLPMGLPENVRVIAWGLSLERPTMIKYGIASIRDIFGSEIDLNFIKNNPIAFIDGKN